MVGRFRDNKPLDNTKIILIGIGVLVAVLVAMIVAANRVRFAPELVTELVLYALIAVDLTMLAALAFVLAGLASMGMPGFSGFPAELSILIGTWKTSPLWATFAAVGVLVVYAGAPHGYSMADTSMYDEAGAERHFNVLRGLLDRTL